jgi:hypothetical protein
MKRAAQRTVWVASAFAIGCSYVVSADRSKVNDTLYLPVPVIEPADAGVAATDGEAIDSAPPATEGGLEGSSPEGATANEGGAESEGGSGGGTEAGAGPDGHMTGDAPSGD